MNTLLKYTYAGAIILGATCMTSCDDFLDTNPDNRATIDNEQKVENVLVGAYPDKDHIYVAELVSDNIDDYGENNPETERFCEDTWAWKDEKENDNESLNDFWESSFVSISAANEALKAIAKLPESSAMKEAKGEALMCRAYNYFMLANMFCMPYDKAKNDKQLGLPYLTEPEVKLNPTYKRGNMTELYNHIQADIEEGLPLVNGSYYTVPKYHFNKRAAYALATRFYLFTEQWEKAIDAATMCLGDNPAAMLRDWKAMAAMTQSFDAISYQFINADENANLLLLTSYSAAGLFFGPYRYNSRYSHGKYLAEKEDIRATQLWGGYTAFYVTPKAYAATNLDKTVFWKLPYIFEYTDPVAKIGYYRTVYPTLTTDETLLSRAEAYIMLKQYDKACADMNMWMHSMTKSQTVITPDLVNSFYNQCKYSYSDAEGLESQLKKHLNPAFAIDAEGSTQENMLQAVLTFRRTETMHMGLRWFDIKRYGIEIPRRVMNADGVPAKKVDFLSKDDPRRALQLPNKVLDA
ncbi:MAG: RagB/SusD family nutrient uptake outer membrane protein, partial [Prevotellaceae bacterium]|nr:RagB/SusD family nutrient uptake outer membrane protein [Prevotellaceae bacterium]